MACKSGSCIRYAGCRVHALFVAGVTLVDHSAREDHCGDHCACDDHCAQALVEGDGLAVSAQRMRSSGQH